MSQEHCVIILPGLGDNAYHYRNATRDWLAEHQLDPWVLKVGWDQKSYSDAQAYVNQVIRDTLSNGVKTSLIGISAGGSLALNSFAHNPDLNAVVTVASRLWTGHSLLPWLSFGFATRNSQAFRQSVAISERRLTGDIRRPIHVGQQEDWREPIDDFPLTDEMLDRTMCIRGYLDGVVPDCTARIPGAHNVRVPMVSHWGIQDYAFAFPNKMINFIKQA